MCRIAANDASVKASLAYVVASFLTDTAMEILKRDVLFTALALGHKKRNNQLIQTACHDASQRKRFAVIFRGSAIQSEVRPRRQGVQGQVHSPVKRVIRSLAEFVHLHKQPPARGRAT